MLQRQKTQESISTEHLKSESEIAQHYQGTIERLRSTDPEFNEAVGQVLDFDQTKALYRDMYWHHTDKREPKDAFHDTENGEYYPKSPVVILKKGQGFRFISERMPCISKEGVSVDKDKVSPSVWNMLDRLNPGNQVFCCIDKEEFFKTYQALSQLISLKYEDNTELLQNLGISKELFEEVLIRSPHSTISIPKDLEIANELFGKFEYRIYNYNGVRYPKGYKFKKDDKIRSSDHIFLKYNDEPRNYLTMGQMNFDLLNDKTLKYDNTRILMGSIANNGGHGLDLEANKPEYMKWVINWMEEIFNVSRDFNGHAVFRHAGHGAFLVTAEFKPEETVQEKIKTLRK
jgi:hypothetical protein